jgi:hypothetical protein
MASRDPRLTAPAPAPQHRTIMHGLRARLIVVALTLIARAASAADGGAPPPPGARAPEVILADFSNALGAAAAAKYKNLHLRRELSITAMGMKGSEERWAAAGDKLLAVMTISGIGTIKQGSTGTASWSEDPINGLRLLSGAEADMAHIEGAWNADLRLGQLFAKIRTVPAPPEAPRDSPLECVELSPKVAHPLTMCFDARTHLRVFQAGKQASPQGEVPYTARQSEWRAVAGLMVPGLEVLTTGPTVMELRLLELTFDGKVDPNLFRVPRVPTIKPPAAIAPPKAAGKAPPKVAPAPRTAPDAGAPR